MNNRPTQWRVDLPTRTASHASGMKITFEGIPGSDHFDGSPKDMPRDITALALARLIREGFDAFCDAYHNAIPERPRLKLRPNPAN